MNNFNPYGHQSPYTLNNSGNNQNGGMTWVQGEAGANAYQVAPGHVMVLFDSTRDVFYIKSVDMYGKPSPLETYDFKKHVDVAKNETTDMSQYVTKAELEEILKGMKATPEKTK